ncbi:MAG TPA: ABC transporter ATP-binding protein [Ktedonobacteraceae bacterium]|nr:ABC transporter ATP-binding protein [Ktedonobacteraceae bacterium]
MVDNTPLLDMQGITFGYNRQPLLYDVHFQARAGEMVGLLGPNGSGKTTLLRLISGVLRPQEGTVILDGRDARAWGRREMARRVAVVPQEMHVPFAFTVQELVSLGRTPYARLLGSSTQEDQRMVRNALQATDIETLAGRIFNELSGGERQRVTVAMALAQRPALLLLDEPTSHLDIKYQIELLELVQHLNRETGVTVIAAMHDLNLAARYFPRLVLFQRGIVADATPAEVLEPHLLRRVYGINVQVGILRGAEHISILPPGDDVVADDEPPATQALVHVMAGGGSGELLMRALADARIPFSAGALNIGDSDHTLALHLAQDVITEQPYAPISPAILEQVRARLAQVALLILCPVPVGPGNLSLLHEAVEAAQRGVTVLLLVPTAANASDNDTSGDTLTDEDALLQQTAIRERDYTGGAGVNAMRELLQHGARVVNTVSESVNNCQQVTFKG